MKKERVLEAVVTAASILLIVWGIASWADIIMHNAGGDMTYHYAVWNIFKLLF